MTYNTKDSYTDDEKATIRTLNAVEEQARLRYARNVKHMTGQELGEGRAFWRRQDNDYLRGMMDGLANLTHINGTIAAYVAITDSKRRRGE